MVTNDRILLDQILDQGLAQVDPGTTPNSYFEFFTAEQILKDFDLSADEIESGLVGDGGDGGIDAIYLLVNGELVQEDPGSLHLRGILPSISSSRSRRPMVGSKRLRSSDLLRSAKTFLIYLEACPN